MFIVPLLSINPISAIDTKNLTNVLFSGMVLGLQLIISTMAKHPIFSIVIIGLLILSKILYRFTYPFERNFIEDEEIYYPLFEDEEEEEEDDFFDMWDDEEHYF